MVKDIHDVKSCPECGNSDIMHNDLKQQVVCKSCGMIFEPMAPAREEQFERAAGMNKEE